METEYYAQTEPEAAGYDRDLGVDDLSRENRRLVRALIKETIADNFRPLDPSIEVVEIYVYGSFAEGNAARMFSDLDLRVVVDGNIDESNAERMAQTIKTSVTGQLPDDRLFGYVDPQVYPVWSDAAEGEVVL